MRRQCAKPRCADFVVLENGPPKHPVALHPVDAQQPGYGGNDDVLITLTPREERVIKMRFGLEDGTERTLEEVGQAFGVTRERIRQIEAKALRKLRHPGRSRQLRAFVADV